jgi:hypothetical protein
MATLPKYLSLSVLDQRGNSQDLRGVMTLPSAIVSVLAPDSDIKPPLHILLVKTTMISSLFLFPFS